MLGGGALALAGAGAVLLQLRGMGSMDDYNAAVARTRQALSEHPGLLELIGYATLAPNGHNTQPWRFHVASDRIEIRPDFARRTPAVDPDDHHIFVRLGCAAESLALAAAARGRPGMIAFDSAGGAVFAFGDGPAAEPDLVDAIPHRQSTRADYDGRPVSAGDLRALALAGQTPGVDLVLITDRPQINRVRDLVVAANTAQMADAGFVKELRSWLRFSPHQALRTGDGLFGPTTGNPPLPAWLGPSMFDLAFKAGAENDKYARQLATSAGVAVFVSAKDDREHWMRAGRACQRFALQATALGLKLAFVNQPVEVAQFRPDLAALAGLPGRRPDLVLRFGYGPALPFSVRRPVDAVLV